jgi:hypothetical protein
LATGTAARLLAVTSATSLNCADFFLNVKAIVKELTDEVISMLLLKVGVNRLEEKRQVAITWKLLAGKINPTMKFVFRMLLSCVKACSPDCCDGHELSCDSRCHCGGNDRTACNDGRMSLNEKRYAVQSVASLNCVPGCACACVVLQHRSSA